MATTVTDTPPNGMAKTARFLASRLALVALSAVLASCAQPSKLERSSLSTGVASRDAFALPPPGGPAVVDVIERRYVNAIQQDIVLATDSAVPGQNLLRIQLFGPVGSEGGATVLTDRLLSESQLAREMRQMLPGVAMTPSPYYAQNGYGPFGYAFGRHGSGDLCLYGWQRIAGSRDSALVSGTGTIQVRLRICQAGASETSLLANMYHYTINASFGSGGWNPYGPAPAVDPRLGATGQPIYPLGAEGVATVLDPAPVPAVRRPRRAAAAAPAAPEIPSPPPGAPVVPPPPEDEPGPAPVVPPPPGEE